MQPKFEYRDESAWDLGDQAYELGDTFETGVQKAAQLGIRPGANGYAAFITAFSRRLRSKQPAAKKHPFRSGDASQPGSAVVFTPDFLRAAS